ncbi:hypothetical protein BDW59DRAFT_159380 [Aspergillus cavernicola]|uniref:Uncharacterized protein n=1 Tax=Aspergillus cavernicola TaxID=176166 RepID=A0ABR4IMH8_9EURO
MNITPPRKKNPPPTTENLKTQDTSKIDASNIHKIFAKRLHSLSVTATLNRNQPHPHPVDAKIAIQCLDTLDSLFDGISDKKQEKNLSLPLITSRDAGIKSKDGPTKNDTSTKKDTSTKPEPASKGSIFDESTSGRIWTHLPFELQSIHKELSEVVTETSKHRYEDFQIFEAMNRQIYTLKTENADLEDQNKTLHAHCQDDLTEWESLRGTIRGLADYITSWKQDCDSAGAGQVIPEAPFDGVKAWLSGWESLEEGFQKRKTGRTVKRRAAYSAKEREKVVERQEIENILE